MRKRIVIGVLAIIGIGVLVCVVSQPKNGTVKWHKREYLDVWRRLNGLTLADKAKQLFYRITGRKPPAWSWSADDGERLQSHRAALLKLGYLERRTFVLTNSQATFHPRILFEAGRKVIPKEHMELTRGETHIGNGTNWLHVICPRDDIPIWEEVIRNGP